MESPKRGVHKIVDATELEGHTAAGWLLVSAMEEELPAFADEALTSSEIEALQKIPTPGYGGGYSPGIVQRDVFGQPIPYGYRRRAVFAKTTRYLVVQDEESRLRVVTEDRKRLEAIVAHLNQEASAKSEELRAAQKLAATHETELVRVRSDLDTEKERRRASAEKERKMEGDIAKFKRALGELKVKEILSQ